jgi:hypothetical protein
VTKDEIAKRFEQLEQAAQSAAGQERVRQRQERIKLQGECDSSGGHYFAAHWNHLCVICGYDKNTPAQTTARNLGVSAWRPLFGDSDLGWF